MARGFHLQAAQQLFSAGGLAAIAPSQAEVIQDDRVLGTITSKQLKQDDPLGQHTPLQERKDPFQRISSIHLGSPVDSHLVLVNGDGLLSAEWTE
jgi:hypothetical protein